MLRRPVVVLLLDVDNTLLDNDRFTAPASTALRDDRRQAAYPRRHEAGDGERPDTVIVRQGHLRTKRAGMVIDPAPDRSIDRIGALCDHGLDWFATAMPAASAAID